QRDHSKLDRFLLDRNCRRALVYHFTDGVRNFQKLINSLPAFLASVVTSVATFTVEELFLAKVAARNTELRQHRVVRPVRRAALSTDAAQQPLTEDSFQG